MTKTTDRRAAHTAKMARKAIARAKFYSANGNEPLPTYTTNGRGMMVGNFPASINRHTGKPHTHSREIARRLGAA